MTVANGYQQMILDGRSFGEILRSWYPHLADAEPEKRPAVAHLRASLARTRRELARISRMPLAKALPYFKEKLESSQRSTLADREKRERRRKAELAKYRAMERTVLAWRAPKALAETKQSLLRTIREGIAFDCSPEAPHKPWTTLEYIEWHIQFLRQSIVTMEKQIAERRLEWRERNARIRAFRRLLAKHPVPAKTEAA